MFCFGLDIRPIVTRVATSILMVWQQSIYPNFWSVEMSSLAFSVGNCSSTKLTSPKTRRLSRYFNKTEVSAIKFSSCPPQKLHQLNENPTPFRRREAIGFGLCFGLVDVVLQTQPGSAAEGADPCELTVAPSGLAFCDKLVGVGPEAVKGQLIKVINISFYNLFLLCSCN